MEIISGKNRGNDKGIDEDDAINGTNNNPDNNSYFIKIRPSKIAHSIIIIRPPSKEEGKKRRETIKQG